MARIQWQGKVGSCSLVRLPVLDKMEWSYDNVRLLIDLYRERPLLWDTKSSDYRDKAKRQDALMEIANSFGLEKEEIERKIKNLICHFSREVKKERDSARSSVKCKDRYKSKWFCFNSMMFLKNRKRSKEIIITQVADEKASRDVSDENYEAPPTPYSSRESTACTSQNEEELPMKLFCSSKRRIKTISDPVQNECMKFGELIAIKLQKFGNEERSILMHRINNFIYEAEAEMYAHQHYSYNSASSAPSSPTAFEYNQVQSHPLAPEAPVNSSHIKQEFLELSLSNCNSSQ